MKRDMFIKKMAERYNMANNVNNKVSFTASENSVVIKIGDVTMVYPKGTLSLHADESNTDSIEVRLTASRKNILSFNYKDLTTPIVSDVNDAITKLNQII
mgnify:FL=1